jgi:phytanoyl-CoA hydroxylase
MSTEPHAPPTITSKQKQDFEDLGFLVVPNVITGELLKQIQTGYRRAIDGQVHTDFWDKKYKRGELLQLPGPSQHIEELQGEEHLDLMVAVARQLLDDRLSFWYDQLIYKPAGNPWETLWHQDAGYWKDMEESSPAMTAWLAVEDVSEDMGCMSFVPRSHKQGTVEHKNASKDNPISGALEAVCQPEEIVKVPLNAGDVSFHHKNTLHYTSGNHGNADRCGLVNHMRAM